MRDLDRAKSVAVWPSAGGYGWCVVALNESGLPVRPTGYGYYGPGVRERKKADRHAKELAESLGIGVGDE